MYISEQDRDALLRMRKEAQNVINSQKLINDKGWMDTPRHVRYSAGDDMCRFIDAYNDLSEEFKRDNYSFLISLNNVQFVIGEQYNAGYYVLDDESIRDLECTIASIDFYQKLC